MPAEQDKFLKVRRGIFEHLAKGWIDETMLVAYMVLLDQCDYSTGVWTGSAIRLSKTLGWSRSKSTRALRLLDKARYITSKFKNNGECTYYNVYINKYTPPKSKTTARMRPTSPGLGRVPESNMTYPPQSNIVEDTPLAESNMTHPPQSNLTTIQDSRSKTKDLTLSRRPEKIKITDTSKSEGTSPAALGPIMTERQIKAAKAAMLEESFAIKRRERNANQTRS